MDFDELNKILEIVREHELSEFELEREGFKIKIRKGTLVQHQFPAAPQAAPAVYPPAVARSAPQPQLTDAAAVAARAAAQAMEEIDLVVVKSPIVGTFFRSAERGAPSFVEIGDLVKKGQVLCIIEAMKLMNEIASEYDGEIVGVYVENEQPVQYGERLFAIKPPSDV